MEVNQTNVVDNSTDTGVNTSSINIDPNVNTNQPKEDLSSRINSFKPSDPNQPQPNTDDKFDSSKLNTIKTPEEAKAFAEDAYKSLQRGYEKKFQDVATTRKEYEHKLGELSNWTPEKVQQLTQNPQFVKAAQQVAGVQEGEESYLSDTDKKLINDMNDIKQQMSQTQLQNHNLLQKQQDATLTGKYANYAPDMIDTFQKDLIEKRYNATREDIWKVIDYEKMGERAYKLGLEDGQKGRTERSNASSIDGSPVTELDGGPDLKGLTGRAAINVIIQHRLKEKYGSQR